MSRPEPVKRDVHNAGVHEHCRKESPVFAGGDKWTELRPKPQQDLRILATAHQRSKPEHGRVSN